MDMRVKGYTVKYKDGEAEVVFAASLYEALLESPFTCDWTMWNSLMADLSVPVVVTRTEDREVDGKAYTIPKFPRKVWEEIYEWQTNLKEGVHGQIN